MKIPTQGDTSRSQRGTTISSTWHGERTIGFATHLSATTRFDEDLPTGNSTVNISFRVGSHVCDRAEDAERSVLLSMMTGGENRSAPPMGASQLLAGTPTTPTGHLPVLASGGRGLVHRSTPFDMATASVTGKGVLLSAQYAPVRYATFGTVSGRSSWTARGQNVTSGCRKAPGSRGRVLRRSWPGAQQWEGAQPTLWTLTLDTGALTQVTYLDDTNSISLDTRRQAHPLCAVSNRPRPRTTSMCDVLTDGAGKRHQPIPAQ